MIDEWDITLTKKLSEFTEDQIYLVSPFLRTTMFRNRARGVTYGEDLWFLYLHLVKKQTYKFIGQQTDRKITPTCVMTKCFRVRRMLIKNIKAGRPLITLTPIFVGKIVSPLFEFTADVHIDEPTEHVDSLDETAIESIDKKRLVGRLNADLAEIGSSDPILTAYINSILEEIK
jgi:hypothetical protein